MATCSQCGTRLPPGAGYCGSCGSTLFMPEPPRQTPAPEQAPSQQAPAPEQLPSQPDPPPQRPLRKRRSRLFLAAVVLASVIVVAVIASLSGDGADKATVTDTVGVDESEAAEAPASTASTPSTTTTAAPTAALQSTTTTPWTPKVYLGSGDDVISPYTGGAPRLIYIESDHLLFPEESTRDFGVQAYGEGGQLLSVLVSSRTPYEGIRPLDFIDGQLTTKLVILSSSTWTVEIRALETAHVLDGPEPLDGRGDDVLRTTGSPRTLHVRGNTAGGTPDFGVFAWTLDGREVLVTTAEPYDGRVMVPPGTLYVEIQAAGGWTIAQEP